MWIVVSEYRSFLWEQWDMYLLDHIRRLVQPRQGTKNKGRGFQCRRLLGKSGQRQRGGVRCGGLWPWTQPTPAPSTGRPPSPSVFLVPYAHINDLPCHYSLPPLNSLWDKRNLPQGKAGHCLDIQITEKFASSSVYYLWSTQFNFINKNIYGNKR